MAGQLFRWSASCFDIGYFLTWAQGFSNAMASIGWIKTSDTGQVNFATQVATFVVTQVTAAGTTATYQYASLSGAALANGMWVSIRGCANANFNVASGTLANLNTGASTFTLTITSTTATETPNASGWAATGLPQSSGTGVYEVWKMNDALQTACPVVLRVDYRNLGNTNNAGYIYFTTGQATNGAGGIYGGMSTTHTGNSYAVTPSTLEDCWFNGGTNWMGCVMWRTSGATQAPIYFAIERSHDSNGNDTSDYVTNVALGYDGSTAQTRQQTMFKPGYGAPTANEPNSSAVVVMGGNNGNGYGNNVGLSPVYPWVGKADNPMYSTVVGRQGDFAETGITNFTIYGSSHPYYMTGAQGIGWFGTYQNGNSRVNRVGLRWD